MDEFELWRAQWVEHFEHALHADTWGQILEAAAAYQRLAEHMVSRVVRDTVAACERRYASLFNLSEGRIDAGTDDPPRTVMRDHLADVRALFPRTAPPAAGGPAPPAASAAAGAEATAEQQEEALAASAPPEDEGPRGGSLVPAPEYEPGKAYLAIRVSTAGLKDAMTYTHPFIRVSVRDLSGRELELAQDLPRSNRVRQQRYMEFGSVVHIQTPHDDLIEADAAIFFELMHYKPAKNRDSCRCWAMLEMGEVSDGPVALEWYKKVGPGRGADPSRRNLRLHTVKDLFLGLDIYLVRSPG